MSDAHGGGDGGAGRFLIGVVAGIFFLWVLSLYRTGEIFGPVSDTVLPERERAALIETDRETDTEEVFQKEKPAYSTTYTYSSLPPGHPPLAEHGVTYYLDKNGEIIDIYRY